MADILGRALSTAVPQVIQNIRGIEEIRAERQNQRMKEYEFKQIQEKTARDNRLIPISSIRSSFPTMSEQAFNHLLGRAGSLGYLEDIEGTESIRSINLEKFFTYLDTDTGKLDLIQAGTLGLKDTEAKIQNINTLMNPQPTEDGKQPKTLNEKQIQGFQAQLQQLEQIKAAQVNALDHLRGIKPKEEEKPVLPYKVGERQQFIGKNGKKYEGTFQGLDPQTNEPVFSNQIEIKEKEEKKPYYEKEAKLTRIIDKFNADPTIRATEKMDEFANLITTVAESDNPIGHASLETLMARASGEVGNLSEADKRPFGGSRALDSKIKQYFSELYSGKKTSENLKFINDLAISFRNAGLRKKQSMAKERAKQYSKANPDLSEQDIYEALSPNLEQQPTTSTGGGKTTHAEMPNPAQYNGKTMTDTDTGKKYKSDGKKWIPL